MQKPQTPDPCEFHLQLRHTEWVIWGYGPFRENDWKMEYIEPALVVVNLENGIDMEFSFKLPKARKNGEDPQEYRRVTSWAWRSRSNDYRVDTRWELADSREHAISDALEWARTCQDNNGWVRNGWRQSMEDALQNDIREY